LARCARASLAILLTTGAAAAQPAVASGDAAMAETLFTEAKRLMASGDYPTACPKLAESYRLDPGSGTLTALAVCHDHVGKTASAWAEFVEVASSAQRQGRADREAFARQNIARLEPLLSRLTIRVPPEVAHLSKLQVRRDSVVIGSAAWGMSVPVDPGDHVVEVTAQDKETWSTHVMVGTSADKKEVVVAPLVDSPKAVAVGPAPEEPTPEPAAPEPATPAPPPPADHVQAPSPQRTIALVVGGAGIVSLAVGSYFGIEAISKRSDAKRLCPMSTCGDMTGVSDNNDAKSAALVADVAIGVGLVAIGAGAFMFLTAPKGAAATHDSPAPETGWRLVPILGRTRAGLTLRATW
jgi:hypothetical protein